MASKIQWNVTLHMICMAAVCAVSRALLFSTGLSTVNYTRQGLLDVPTGESIPSDTEQIDLSQNNINNLTLIGYSHLKSLKSFNISRNQISLLTPNAFIDLTTLVVLDLSRNAIQGEHIEEHMFVDLRKLQTLHLERNPLRILKSSVFNFMELPSLTHLDVSHCEISTLEQSCIDLPTLEYLDLSWNAITEVNKEALRMMADLKTLDMSHNRIKTLDTVPSLPAIQTWNLDSNWIEEVHIKDQVWIVADSIEKLYLRNNKIMRFGPDDLPLDLATLKVIAMENNDLHCDCRMKWIANTDIEALDKRDITMTCRYPSRLADKDVLSLPADELTCSMPVTRLLLIIMVSVIGAVSLALGVYLTAKWIRRRRRIRRAAKNDQGGDYSAVYTRDEEDVRVTMSDGKGLLDNSREFDV